MPLKERAVMLEKNNLIYCTALAAILLWDIGQAISVYDNSTLLLFSSFTIAITVLGLLGTLSDIESIRNTWMLWYSIPAGLIGFASVQGNAELQNNILTSIGIAALPLPLDGSSKDYTAAVYSHYLSMCAPAVAWAMAYGTPLTQKLYRKIRA